MLDLVFSLAGTIRVVTGGVIAYLAFAARLNTLEYIAVVAGAGAANLVMPGISIAPRSAYIVEIYVAITTPAVLSVYRPAQTEQTLGPQEWRYTLGILVAAGGHPRNLETVAGSDESWINRKAIEERFHPGSGQVLNYHIPIGGAPTQVSAKLIVQIKIRLTCMSNSFSNLTAIDKLMSRYLI